MLKTIPCYHQRVVPARKAHQYRYFDSNIKIPRGKKVVFLPRKVIVCSEASGLEPNI
jgi:hypothetical protein